MASVAVIISTYNGEKYLKEQLDSVLNQTGVEVGIFVRDDGSSDGTKEILSGYAEKFPNVDVEFAQNVGVGNSFMNALYSVTDGYDYYAFCDQDDIWEENKLISAVNVLEQSGKVLCATNQECVDKEGNSLGLRYSENTDIHLSPVSILEENMLAGCTMVWTAKFNALLREDGKRPSPELLRNRIHDVWLAMVASLYDGIAYDERSFIKYRQHENNVVGASADGFSKRLKKRLKKLTSKELRNGRSKLAEEICEKFPAQAAKFPIVVYCSQAKTCKGKNRILKNSKELRSYTKESGVGFFFKVIFGWF